MKNGKMGKRVFSFVLSAIMIFSLCGAAHAVPAEEMRRAMPSWSVEEAVPAAPAQAAQDGAAQESAQAGETAGLRQAVDAIAAAVLSWQSELPLAEYQLTENDLIQILEVEMPTAYPMAMELDSYVYGINRQTGIVQYLRFTYPYPAEEMEGRRVQTEQMVQAVLAQVDPDWTDLEKVKAVHDYLVTHVSYAELEWKEDPGDRTIYTAYGALVEGRAVCQGYALSFQLLMQRLGVESLFVSSSMMNHAWNMVQLDGSWYHVDCTWDDPVPDVPGRVLYTAFLVSDVQLSGPQVQHYGWSPLLPKAEDTRYDGAGWTRGPVLALPEIPLDTWSYQGTEGGVYQFLAKVPASEALTVTSSNPAAASVQLANANDPRGQLYTLTLAGAGEAEILVTSATGAVASFPVTVQAASAAAA